MRATIACQYTAGTSRRGDMVLRSRSPRKCHYPVFAYPLFKRALSCFLRYSAQENPQQVLLNQYKQVPDTFLQTGWANSTPDGRHNTQHEASFILTGLNLRQAFGAYMKDSAETDTRNNRDEELEINSSKARTAMNLEPLVWGNVSQDGFPANRFFRFQESNSFKEIGKV